SSWTPLPSTRASSEDCTPPSSVAAAETTSAQRKEVLKRMATEYYNKLHPADSTEDKRFLFTSKISPDMLVKITWAVGSLYLLLTLRLSPVIGFVPALLVPAYIFIGFTNLFEICRWRIVGATENA